MFVYSDLRGKIPRRRHLPHDTPGWVAPGSLYFITVCCRPRGTNQLCHPEVASIVFEATQHRHTSGTWFVRLMLLMPDHLHALIAFPPSPPLAAAVQQWKGRIARRTRIRWQSGFFEHRIRDHHSWEEKAHYIRQNPLRAKLMREDERWAYLWEPDSRNQSR